MRDARPVSVKKQGVAGRRKMRGLALARRRGGGAARARGSSMCQSVQEAEEGAASYDSVLELVLVPVLVSVFLCLFQLSRARADTRRTCPHPRLGVWRSCWSPCLCLCSCLAPVWLLL